LFQDETKCIPDFLEESYKLKGKTSVLHGEIKISKY